MSVQENLQSVQQVYDAFSKGDIEGVLCQITMSFVLPA
jgi:hypothetical protein